jgi:eukaryotic-like serine/threonine-protein kinase
VPLESIASGAYRIVEVLGQGGFGTVYKAHQASLDRFVAIKVLRDDFLSSARDVERFRREARAAARLGGHPNIVTIYDYGEDAGLAYLVLEYIDGPTLHARLRQPLATSEVVTVVAGVAAALDFAHSRGLVHRDVKPSNIMLSRDGRVVLTDFGIVKLLDRDGASTLTAPTTGGIIGTPEYMAPEQITNAEIGPAADLYALGVVCYELLVGRVPFTGSPLSIAHQQVTSRPPVLATFDSRVPPIVERVVQQALAKDPIQRFPTGAALAGALEDALGLSTTRFTPSTPRSGRAECLAEPASGRDSAAGTILTARVAPNHSGRLLILALLVVNLLAFAVSVLSLSGLFGPAA